MLNKHKGTNTVYTHTKKKASHKSTICIYVKTLAKQIQTDAHIRHRFTHKKLYTSDTKFTHLKQSHSHNLCRK